ncbi:GntR family transcriptional regulator [Thioalkalivibrio denitrificans]|uniref:GntR family transcriptional regulator n=1 Tax=Thioalkalivibrio denitrificans TaxID=108003 RepID=A0A1V3NKR9_9GAMM|nr:DoxX family protein [Thioalkalivibrio denitrificans]OOG25717.1 GntR family transcriptional regulator [Thioalkalivibrio denitrificans]
MTEDLGKLILRVTLGWLILMHGIHKLIHGVSGIEGMIEGIGLPGFLAYTVYIGEVLAPVLLILGFYARVGAALIAVTMVVAIALAHPHELFDLTRFGGWALELQGMFLFTAVALALTGPGRLSINRM